MTTRIRIGVLIGMVAGIALATGVIGFVGFSAVLKALAVIGARGLAFLIAYAGVTYALLATAWFVIAPKEAGGRWRTFFLARTVRDSAGELLPFSQVGGFVAGARAAVLLGLSPTAAATTTLADVTTELIAQLGFTALGLTLLALRLGDRSAHHGLMTAGLAGLGLSAAGATGFIVVQRGASGLAARLAGRLSPALAAQAGDFGRALDELYRRPQRLAGGVAAHFAAWLASAAAPWFALRLAGVPIGLAQVVAIEALIFAVRSAAFVAPMGAGVQEAAYAVIGPAFGLPSEMSLAISLMKRARDLCIGAPVLIAWQTAEGRRLLGRGSKP